MGGPFARGELGIRDGEHGGENRRNCGDQAGQRRVLVLTFLAAGQRVSCGDGLEERGYA